MARIEDIARFTKVGPVKKQQEQLVVGRVDEAGYPLTNQGNIVENCRLLWELARKKVCEGEHYQLSLEQASAIATTPLRFDEGVDYAGHKKDVGFVGEVSLSALMSELWPLLPAISNSYHAGLSDAMKRAYTVRQRLGIQFKRTLLGACLKRGGKHVASTWWIRGEYHEYLPSPAYRTSGHVTRVATDGDPAVPQNTDDPVVDPDVFDDEVEIEVEAIPPAVSKEPRVTIESDNPIKALYVAAAAVADDLRMSGVQLNDLRATLQQRDETIRTLTSEVTELRGRLEKLENVKSLVDLLRDEV